MGGGGYVVSPDTRHLSPGGFPFPQYRSDLDFKQMIMTQASLGDIAGSPLYAGEKNAKKRAEAVRQRLCNNIFRGVLEDRTCYVRSILPWENFPTIDDLANTSGYISLRQFFADWFDKKSFRHNVTDGGRTEIVFPSGEILRFLLDPDPGKQNAAAQMIRTIVPILFDGIQQSSKTTFLVGPGGAVILPDDVAVSQQIPYYPTAQGETIDLVRDARWAGDLCSHMLEPIHGQIEDVYALLLAPTQGETGKDFQKRIETQSRVLERCAADVSDIAGFLKVCPIDKSYAGPVPKECEIVLKRLERHLREKLFANPNEKTKYDKVIKVLQDEEHSANTLVQAVAGEVHTHLWGAGANPEVRQWLLKQWDVVEGLTVRFPVEGGDVLDEKEERRRVALLGEIVSVLTFQGHWWDRMANVVWGAKWWIALSVAVPLLAVLLGKLCLARRLLPETATLPPVKAAEPKPKNQRSKSPGRSKSRGRQVSSAPPSVPAPSLPAVPAPPSSVAVPPAGLPPTTEVKFRRYVENLKILQSKALFGAPSVIRQWKGPVEQWLRRHRWEFADADVATPGIISIYPDERLRTLQSIAAHLSDQGVQLE